MFSAISPPESALNLILRARPQIIESTFDRVRYWGLQPSLILYVVVVIDIEPIRERFSAVAPFPDERGRRLVAAAEAFPAGYGGAAAGALRTGGGPRPDGPAGVGWGAHKAWRRATP